MKLTDLLNKITPLPWKSVPAFHSRLGMNNDRYATHAANVLPELVEVLQRVQQENHCTPDTDKLIEAVLARATEVKS